MTGSAVRRRSSGGDQLAMRYQRQMTVTTSTGRTNPFNSTAWGSLYWIPATVAASRLARISSGASEGCDPGSLMHTAAAESPTGANGFGDMDANADSRRESMVSAMLREHALHGNGAINGLGI